MPAPMQTGGLPLATLLAGAGAPQQPMPSSMVPGTPPQQGALSPAPAPTAPPSLDGQNAAAMMALQGQGSQLPPNYEAEPQPNGSILLVEIDPVTGHKNVIKVVSAPKRFQKGQPPQGG